MEGVTTFPPITATAPTHYDSLVNAKFGGIGSAVFGPGARLRYVEFVLIKSHIPRSRVYLLHVSPGTQLLPC